MSPAENSKALVERLRAERDEARQIVRDIHWMARRYADGRMSYAVSMFNDAVRKAFDAGWLEWKNAEPRYASDGMFSAEWVAQADTISALQAALAKARNDALEEAAMVALSVQTLDWGGGEEWAAGYVDGKTAAASAIRSLKTEGQ